MDAHPNLYVDLAARLPEIGRHDPTRLRAMFVKHSDRILFGTDLGLSPGGFVMLGSFGKEPNRRSQVGPYFKAHWRFLETRDKGQPSPTPIQGRWTIDGLGLDAKSLARIYRTNAIRLFGDPDSHWKKFGSLNDVSGPPQRTHDEGAETGAPH